LLIHFNELLSKGFDGQHFIQGLASHFRNLMVCKNPQTVTLLEVDDEAQKNYVDQAQKCTLDFLLAAIEKANQCDLNYKLSQNQRLLVELTLLQIASLLHEPEKKKLIHS
ncbi:hypothetical protein RZS08_66095, partial [Arthrospira platensis SPKY1]|nr:hypothetical protein [Arthrospira platensis SPKY1]